MSRPFDPIYPVVGGVVIKPSDLDEIQIRRIDSLVDCWTAPPGQEPTHYEYNAGWQPGTRPRIYNINIPNITQIPIHKPLDMIYIA